MAFLCHTLLCNSYKDGTIFSVKTPQQLLMSCCCWKTCLVTENYSILLLSSLSSILIDVLLTHMCYLVCFYIFKKPYMFNCSKL